MKEKHFNWISIRVRKGDEELQKALRTLTLLREKKGISVSFLAGKAIIEYIKPIIRKNERMSRAIKLKLKDYEYLYEYGRYSEMKLTGENLFLAKKLIGKLEKKEMHINQISVLFNKNLNETKDILLAIQADFAKITLDMFLISFNDIYKLTRNIEEINEYWDTIQDFTNRIERRSLNMWYIQENLIQKAKKEQKAKTKSKE